MTKKEEKARELIAEVMAPTVYTDFRAKIQDIMATGFFNKTELAAVLGCSPQHIRNLLAENHAVSYDLGVKIIKVHKEVT